MFNTSNMLMLTGSVVQFSKSDTTLAGKGMRQEGKTNEFQNVFQCAL